MVPIIEIAEALGISKDYALRLVKRRAAELGLKPIRGKRNAVFLSKEDADLLIQSHEPRRPSSSGSGDGWATTDFGFFYLIQLHPEDLPDRVKLGYTDNLTQRLHDHRTTAPTLKLLRSWPCKRTWEAAAISSITRSDCRRKGHEVFDGKVDRFLTRAGAFFALMPKPEKEQ